MRRNLLLILACFAAGLFGANVQPILTGAGKLIFPENATPANLSASSGALTVAAGGSNQNINLTPSGTGLVSVGGTDGNLNASGVLRTSGYTAVTGFSGAGLELLYASGGYVQAFDRTVATYQPLTLSGSHVTVGTGNFGPGGNTSPGYAVDTTGDTNTSGVYRKGGTAGTGNGSTITVCTSGACLTSCTLIFNGGIRTGGNCP